MDGVDRSNHALMNVLMTKIGHKIFRPIKNQAIYFFLPSDSWSTFIHSTSSVLRTDYSKDSINFIFGLLLVNLCRQFYAIFEKKDPRPIWTKYKHVLDNAKKCLSVGYSGILSVVIIVCCCRLCPRSSLHQLMQKSGIFTKSQVYYSS